MENTSKSAYEYVCSLIEFQGSLYNGEYQAAWLMDGLKKVHRDVLSTMYIEGLDDFTYEESVFTKARELGIGDSSYEQAGVSESLIRSGHLEGNGYFWLLRAFSEEAKALPVYMNKIRPSEATKRIVWPLIPYVPAIGLGNGKSMPSYIPTPVPIGLSFGMSCMCSGSNYTLPSFSPKSMLDAYLNNDHRLLRSSIGHKIVGDSGIRDLWELGTGQFYEKFNIRELDDRIIMSCKRIDPIKISRRRMKPLIDSGAIKIEEHTTENGGVVVEVLHNKDNPNVTREELLAILDVSFARKFTYTTRGLVGKTIYNVTLRDWIDITYKNYKRLFGKYIVGETGIMNGQLNAIRHFDEIVESAKRVGPNELGKISQETGVDEKSISWIMSKNSSEIIETTSNENISNIARKIEDMKSIDVDRHIYDNILRLDSN